MRKFNFLFLIALLCGLSSYAQITGTKTIGTDYPTIADAITALNTQGVGAGGATINVPGGYTETAPVGGYILGSTVLNASLSATSPLGIIKSGSGANPLLTAPAGTSTTIDAIFTLAGADYTTIDGINLIESSSNTTAILAMERGFSFVNLNAAAPFDGCQHNTIQNSVITLNRTLATPSVGIYFSHTTATSGTALTITTVDDAHSYNKIYSNKITNVIRGILCIGYQAALPYTLYDQNNDFGGNSATTGNTITNFGTQYASIYGIIAQFQNGINVSFNTINNLADGGAVTNGSLYGINVYGLNSTHTVNNNNVTVSHTPINATYFVYAIACDGGAAFTANNNTISSTLVSGTTGSSLQNGGVVNSAAAMVATGNTISLVHGNNGPSVGIYSSGNGSVNYSNNSYNFSTTASSTGAHYGLYTGTALSGTMTMQNNALTFTSGASATGTVYAIYAASTVTGQEIISDNKFTNFAYATTGSLYLIFNTNNTNNKTISNNSINGTFNKAGGGGTVYGYYNFGTPTGGTSTITGNNFSNVTLTGATAFSGIQNYTVVAQAVNMSNNTISNITGGTGVVYPLYVGDGGLGTTLNNNTLSNINGGGTTYGLYFTGTGNNLTASGNTIAGITSSGAASPVFPMYVAGGTAVNLTRNKISNVTASGATGVANGIGIAAGTLVTVSNNFISDLKAPNASSATSSVNGININSTSGFANYYLYNNSINVNASSVGTNFNTAAVLHSGNATATTAKLTMINNILVNTSTANGTGKTVAFRKLNVNLANYAAESNNNLLYAGTPSSTNVIFFDATNADETLADYQTRVATRDANSISVLPGFVSATDIHLTPEANCAIDGKGQVIATVTTDIDGDARDASTPDIGADEFTNTFNLTVNSALTGCSVANLASAVIAPSTTSTLTYWMDAAATIAIPAANGTANAITVSDTYYIKSTNGSCEDIKAVVVTITQPATAAISYANAGYCTNAGVVTVIQTGTSGGTYTALPTGLSINATTGAITTSGSTAGTYTVTYTIAANGPCPAIAFTTTVTISAPPTAVITYGTTPICTTTAVASVTLTGTAGGTYSALPTGLSINTTTGEINVTASAVGTYTVSYTVNGANGCSSVTATASVKIEVCGPPTVSVTATAGTLGPITYPTLKTAFDAINAGTHQGAIAVSIIDNTNEGATPAVLNGSVSPANYTSVSIRPASDGLSIVGGAIPASRGVIELNGADNVTFDGDNPNTTGTNRNLTITLTGTNGVGLIWIKSLSTTDGAQNNTIKNCNLIGQNRSNTTIGILAGSNTFGGPAVAPNSNTTIENNLMNTVQNSIYWNGYATAPYDVNLKIIGNTMGSTVAANKNIFRGLILQGVSNFDISKNTILGVESAVNSTANMTGIQIAGLVTNGIIANNSISDIKQINPIGYGAAGITLGTSLTTSNITVYNNYISDVAAQGYASGRTVSDNGYGLAIVAGGGYNVYHNTILMNTNQTNNGLPAALLVNTVATNNTLNIRNNIFANTQTTGTNRYSVISVATAARYAELDNNVYYTTGPNLGYLGSANVATFAAWQTATGKDASSLNLLPSFVSPTDLHLTQNNNCLIKGAGVAITTPAITTDFDGDTRSTTKPDIGADEFTVAIRVASIQYPTTALCTTGGTAAVTQTGVTGGTYTTTAGLIISPTTGLITLGTSTPGTYTVTYTVPALGGCVAVVATASVTIQSLSVAPTSATASITNMCKAGTVNLQVQGGTLAPGAVYKWYKTSCGGVPVGTGASLTNIAISETTTFYARIEGACNSTNCVSVTVTVEKPVTVVITPSPSLSINPGSNASLTSTISPAGNYTYQWYMTGVAIAGQTGPNMQVPADNSQGNYTLVVTTPTGCASTSNAVAFTGDPQAKMFITPNPNDGRFKVAVYASSLQIGTHRKLVIFDAKGAKVYEKEYVVATPYTEIDVNIRQKGKGVYFMQVLRNNKVLASGKVLVIE